MVVNYFISDQEKNVLFYSYADMDNVYLLGITAFIYGRGVPF
jgi:hypothetical protein